MIQTRTKRPTTTATSVTAQLLRPVTKPTPSVRPLPPVTMASIGATTTTFSAPMITTLAPTSTNRERNKGFASQVFGIQKELEKWKSKVTKIQLTIDV